MLYPNLTYPHTYPNPDIGSLIYVNVGKKTMKRLRKRPYNLANNQLSKSAFQHAPFKGVWVAG